jgi:hypothetical protein
MASSSAQKAWETRRARNAGTLPESALASLPCRTFPSSPESDQTLYNLSANGFALGGSVLSSDQALFLNALFAAKHNGMKWVAAR